MCNNWLKIRINKSYKTTDFVNEGILQNICLNLPRYAYSSKDESEFIEILEEKIRLCFGILNKKYNLIEKRLNSKHLPLCGSIIEDQPLFRLENQKLTLSFVGLNEAVKVLTDYELHENSDAFDVGKEIITQMNEICGDNSKLEGKIYTLVENPSEKIKFRFAKLDLIHFSDKAKAILNHNKTSYSNSFHYSVNASLDLLERIYKQGEFHELIQNEGIEHISSGTIDKDYGTFSELLSKLCLKSKIGCIKFEN